MLKQWTVAAISLALFSSCIVSRTTIPDTMILNETYPVTVSFSSFIPYGETTSLAPTLCVAAPADWEIEALNYVGYSATARIEGAPTAHEPAGMTYELPEDYAYFCWKGPYGSYSLKSHGKARLLITPRSAGAREIAFISGYDDKNNYFEFPETVEVVEGNTAGGAQ